MRTLARIPWFHVRRDDKLPGTRAGLAVEGQATRLIARMTGVLAITAALLIGIAPPATYFHLRYVYQQGRLEGEIRTQSHLLRDLIQNDPGYWEFEADKLQRLFTPRRDGDVDTIYRVRTENGSVVVQVPRYVDLTALHPTMVIDRDVMLAGKPVARVEGIETIAPLLWQTLLVAAVSVLSALAIYVLRVVPVRALNRAVDRIGFLASHDPLTSLPNRAVFCARLDELLLQCVHHGRQSAILCLGLDRFKYVNDTLGHLAGDELLTLAAGRLRASLRENDLLVRLGGDEFAVIPWGLRRPEDAAIVAGRLITVLAEPYLIHGCKAIVGCSVGIAVTSPGMSSDRLLSNADLALFRAKSEGRGSYRFFEEDMNGRLQARITLEHELHQALRDGQFRVHYQPQVTLRDGRIFGVEALVRWQHPERGFVSPAEFIPLAEETGLIHALGEWVLRSACLEARDWQGVQLAVNLSPVQFRQPGVAAMIEGVLAEVGFDPRRLELEITEGVLLHDGEATHTTLQALKAMGIGMAMDDFGTGYSSLSHLQRFPFDKIKIDRSFVNDLGRADNGSAIVRAVIALSHSLGLPVLAEGVETEQQASLLLAEGCEEAQGYHFGRPMPAAELAQRLAVQRLAA